MYPLFQGYIPVNDCYTVAKAMESAVDSVVAILSSMWTAGLTQSLTPSNSAVY